MTQPIFLMLFFLCNSTDAQRSGCIKRRTGSKALISLIHSWTQGNFPSI